jgi:hypothetical protein
MTSSHGDLAHLLPLNYKRFIADWLEEDCPSFDYGGFVVGESEGEANLLGKSKVSLYALQGAGGLGFWNDITDKLRVLLPVYRFSTKSFPN